MSAIPTELRFGGETLGARACPSRAAFPRRAGLPVAVVGSAAAITAPLLSQLDPGHDDWLTFLILAGSAAVAQLFLVRTGKNQSYQTSIVFLSPRRSCCRRSSWRSCRSCSTYRTG